MNLLRYFFGKRSTFFGLEHSGTINFLRFFYCLVTAITVALYAWEYDRLYEVAPYYPSPLFSMFEDPLPLVWYRALRWLTVAGLTSAALGFLTRPALVFSALTFFVYEGTQLGFTKPADGPYSFHITNLVPFILLIMSIAPGIDRHTLLTTLRKQNEPTLLPEWPRKAMLALIAIAYFGAGYCRCVNSFLWADGHTLQGYLMEKSIAWDIALGWEIAQHWGLCVVISVLTMLLELGYPLVLFFPRFKPLFIFGGIMLHLSILLAMNINFMFFFGYNYFVFLEWPWLRRVFAGVKDRTAELARKIPAPQLAPNWHKWAFGLIVGVQASCVVGRVEAWPFSDFRVFQKRNHPDKIGELFLAKAEPLADGSPDWLPFIENYYLRRAISWEPEADVVESYKVDAAEKQRLLDRARRRMYKAILGTAKYSYVFSRYGTLKVYIKRPVLEPDGERYRVSTEFVMDLAPPDSPLKASGG